MDMLDYVLWSVLHHCVVSRCSFFWKTGINKELHIRSRRLLTVRLIQPVTLLRAHSWRWRTLVSDEHVNLIVLISSVFIKVGRIFITIQLRTDESYFSQKFRISWCQTLASKQEQRVDCGMKMRRKYMPGFSLIHEMRSVEWWEQVS